MNSTSLASGPLFRICNFTNSGVEICDNLDNDCDAAIDNNVVVPPGSITPSVASGLISWNPIPAAETYDAVRGELGLLRASHGNFAQATAQCLANDTPATSLPVQDAPGPGDGWWFLVPAGNCAGAGTWNEGDGSQQGPRDAGIGASQGGCP